MVLRNWPGHKDGANTIDDASKIMQSLTSTPFNSVRSFLSSVIRSMEHIYFESGWIVAWIYAAWEVGVSNSRYSSPNFITWVVLMPRLSWNLYQGRNATWWVPSSFLNLFDRIRNGILMKVETGIGGQPTIQYGEIAMTRNYHRNYQSKFKSSKSFFVAVFHREKLMTSTFSAILLISPRTLCTCKCTLPKIQRWVKIVTLLASFCRMK